VCELCPFESLRVVIADDHPFYREGLARLLRESGIEVVDEVPNGEAAIRAVEETAPNVVIMDLRMPGLSGLETTRRLTEQAPASRVVVLSASAQEADVAEAILAGASGYVVKDAPVEDVIDGIRAAAAGQLLISPWIAAVVLRRVSDAPSSEVDLAGVQLSDRERQALELLAQGNAYHEIAAILMTSASIVRTHISSIIMRLQIENRVHAAARALHERGM
jgi:DNA-binding NarL/FixJ family response regulator